MTEPKAISEEELDDAIDFVDEMGFGSFWASRDEAVAALDPPEQRPN